jgi:hypothetical protein
MELRTTFNIAPFEHKISYTDRVMFIGSCFATSVGKKFETGHIPVMINPSGTVYNPVSVLNSLNTVTDRRKYTRDDLYNHEGTLISFNHYTDFSSEDENETLSRINSRAEEAFDFLSGSEFLFITFGTARVYRWMRSGQIVSNCHRLKASEFTRELLGVNDIVSLWDEELGKLKTLYPQLKVVFTISPVRHWKDGAHGNQVSKSVLFVAVEELLKHPSGPDYFPAYELLMDDLRDYRFYDTDMLHPYDTAVDYIWDAFSWCYFDDKTRNLWNEVSAISKAVSHKIRKGPGTEVNKFAERSLEKIDSIISRIPSINLAKERNYFLDLLSR